jgi:hypothetical protein
MTTVSLIALDAGSTSLMNYGRKKHEQLTIYEPRW